MDEPATPGRHSEPGDHDQSDRVSAALAYARAGHAVFGLQPGTKRPYGGTNGMDDASTDSDTVAQWWTLTPEDGGSALDSNIGNRPAPDELVIDVDVRADGYATLADRIIQLGALPGNTPITRTPTGGRHIRLSYDGGQLIGSLGPGVDIKGHNGYVVMPPSVIEVWDDDDPRGLPRGTHRYTWIKPPNGKPPNAPAAWLAKICKPETFPRPPSQRATTQPRGNRSWADAGVNGELELLARCPKSGTPPGGNPTIRGRNNWLNVVGLRTARLLPNQRQGSWLHGRPVDACHTNGLIADKGIISVEATIKSAFAKADKDGPAPIPEPARPNSKGTSMTDIRESAGEKARVESNGQPTESDLPKTITLAAAHTVFKHWLGDDYDTDALDAMLATAAVEKFDDGSDPLWLLTVSGSGNAKTETVQSLKGIGAQIVSAVSSDAALLSGTPKRERTKDATGGVLRKLGDHGVLVIKDVTSILSMDRNLRGKVLAALREIYDGYWSRDIGTDGGRSLKWEGRIAVVGAVTTAWDTAYSVIATMGDRFALIRVDSTQHRQAAGRKAVRNTGSEPEMRAELADAAAGVIAGMNPEPTTVTDEETETLLGAANLVTLARTAVEYDYRGDVIDAHQPEMPTRFAKQLCQVVRGGVAVGMNRKAALRLAIRVARDSMPPLRLVIIDDLADNPHCYVGEVRRRIDKPRNTVDRQLQALHMLGVLTVDEIEYSANGKTRWFYSLSNDIDPTVLESTKPETFPD